jgi:hypothetical protein
MTEWQFTNFVDIPDFGGFRDKEDAVAMDIDLDF